MDLTHLLALAAALGWASGFRLYAVVFLTGLAGALGWVALPEGLHLLQHPAILVISGVMFCLEFFADKIPGIDMIWELLHSAVRIPAGAALAAAVFGADNTTITLAAALLGGGLAASSQAAKLSTRAAINTSPEPLSNLLASMLEDGLMAGALWLSWHQPLVFAGVLALAVVSAGVLTWVLLRFLRAQIARVRNMFTSLTGSA